MMKIYRLALLSFSLAFFSSAMAEEKSSETARKEIDYKGETDGFVYGAIKTPPNFLSIMFQPDEEPNDEKQFRIRKSDFDLGPRVDSEPCPIRIPVHDGYLDMANILNKHGLRIEGDQWALYSSGMAGDRNIYYCLSVANADILHKIINPHSSLFHFRQHITLVSLLDQGFQNTPWTYEKLIKLSPKIHARLGSVGRSGEKVTVGFEYPKDKKISTTSFESTIGEYQRRADVRLVYTHDWNPQITSNIAQRCNISVNVGQPFILDCGINDKDGRNYLIVLETDEFPNNCTHFGVFNKQIHLDKIDGIYAMRKNNAGPVDRTKQKTNTYAYQCPKGFLDSLRQRLIETIPNGDGPFGDNKKNNSVFKEIPAPLRAKGYKPNKHLLATDKVFDVTPQFRLLFMNLTKAESVYYNATKSRLVLRGSVSIQSRVHSALRFFTPDHELARLNARIVEVDLTDLKAPHWDLEQISKRNPKTLAMYSLTSRNGLRAISGDKMHALIDKTKKTPKDDPTTNWEFELEPTISENRNIIYTRFSLQSKPLGIGQLVISLDSGVTIPDGKTTIIELGHPNSATRTHILILHADVITPDGSFYRDRFKPVE